MYNFSRDTKEKISSGKDGKSFPVSPSIFSFVSELIVGGNWKYTKKVKLGLRFFKHLKISCLGYLAVMGYQYWH